jgi:hypothetical protein
MGDINPSRTAVDSFNKKQKAFREQLLEAQKEREARALAHRKQQAASSQSAQAATNETAGATAEKKHPEPHRKTGPLTNLIYGTKEGRELDAQIEASFSQVLARGKYVHSIVFHEVKPDKVDEYVKLVAEWYPKMANLPENKVHLVGSWRTEVGDCDTFGRLCLPSSKGRALTRRQFTSGSTRSTKAITTLDTTSPTIPSTPTLSAS